MRVFKLLQDLPDVQAGELFIAREVNGVETFFSTLEDDLRYDIKTVTASPLWFQEVAAVHAEFEQVKQQAEDLIAKLTNLQAATPDHANLSPAIDQVNAALDHVTATQAVVTPDPAPAEVAPVVADEPTATLSVDPTAFTEPVATVPVDPQATPESVAQTVEAPVPPVVPQPVVETPDVVTNIEPNPFVDPQPLPNISTEVPQG